MFNHYPAHLPRGTILGWFSLAALIACILGLHWSQWFS